MSTNEGFVVSALKYRPAEWDEVVGQSAITSTLKNAIGREEIAKAYLFCGPRGVGKTTSARIFAKAINSKYIEEGQDLSFNIFELDAASNNSVDDIRQLIDQVRIQPQLGKYKVYIIDEVHMLSTQAFNAFLKTLEEPPPHAIFILATTEKHKVLPTILSRCQIYDFQRIQVRDMVAHLGKIAADQDVTFEEEALHLIATKADGALRDALSLFDQMVSFTGKNLTYTAVASNLNVLDHEYFSRIVTAISEGEIGEALLIYDDILKKGFDSLLFMVGLAEHLRNILVAKDPSTVNLLDSPAAVQQSYLAQAAILDSASIVTHLEQLHKTEVNYRAAKNKRLLTEITLMQLCASHGLSDKRVIEKKKPLATEVEPQPDAVPVVSVQGPLQFTPDTPVNEPPSENPETDSESETQSSDILEESVT
ncbi:MAG: DNA polymerase III subunit gamma/tau, partial [Desulfobulbia bacterium]